MRNEIDFAASSWNEHVYVETTEHIINGFVFMPKVGQKSRLISEILNSGKSFVAITNCDLEYKNHANKEVTHHNFLAINVSSILLMRPYNEQ